MNESKLEPVIGHPKNKNKLDQLIKAEKERQVSIQVDDVVVRTKYFISK